MTDSWYSWPGGRSCPQSKNGFTTTESMVWSLESASLNWVGSPNRYEYSDSSPSTMPSIALAYGSSSSLAGLQRWPFIGSYGPWIR